MGLLAGRGVRERLVTSATHVVRRAKELAIHEAAAIPEAFITAWMPVWLQAGVKRVRRWIHAVGSPPAVGTADGAAGRAHSGEIRWALRAASSARRGD